MRASMPSGPPARRLRVQIMAHSNLIVHGSQRSLRTVGLIHNPPWTMCRPRSSSISGMSCAELGAKLYRQEAQSSIGSGAQSLRRRWPLHIAFDWGTRHRTLWAGCLHRMLTPRLALGHFFGHLYDGACCTWTVARAVPTEAIQVTVRERESPASPFHPSAPEGRPVLAWGVSHC